MTMAAQTPPDVPTAAEVRAQIERMAVSDAFRASPQLVAFLRFVVEAVLTGNSARIKGYTIGVEVLRRDANFDPQIDPIVRVEAVRLRRTLDRYYRGPGIDDAIIVDLPRGGYVPTFSRRAAGDNVVALPSPAAALPQAPARRFARLVTTIAAIAAGVVLIAAIVLLADRLREAGKPAVSQTGPSAVRPPGEALAGNGLPVLAIEPFDVAGAPSARSVLAASLRGQLADAFARFDLANIVGDAPQRVAGTAAAPPSTVRRIDYRFGASVEYGADGAARIGLRLVDAVRGDVIWSQMFERVGPAEDRAAAEEAIVRQVAPALMQPFGVIYAYGRSRIVATGGGDPRYRCLIDAAESFRSFDPAQHAQARACLERTTASDPSFAVGFSYLTAIYLREYQYGIGASPGERSALERALRAARRGVELAPASSRAYEMLFIVLFARRELPAAFAAGDKAVSLNRYDARLRGVYGARLIASGEVDKGLALLERAAADGSIVPAFEQFFLFLGNYLRGDLARASFHAGQLTSDSFQLGLIARALTAQAGHDQAAARRACEQLVALNRAWRDDLRASLARFFAADAIIDRLARDLGDAGIGGT